MAQAKHTQAPWTNMDGYIYGLEGSIPVAEVQFNMYAREEYVANTFLIKMSPELLEIAEEMLGYEDRLPVRVVQDIREVVAKAKGESHD